MESNYFLAEIEVERELNFSSHTHLLYNNYKSIIVKFLEFRLINYKK